MTATNHALTGALIGLTAANPLLAVPLAFASHFVLDAIPHFGASSDETAWLRNKNFRLLLIGEAALCVLLVLLLAVTRPRHWLVGAVAAFAAASPDLFYIGRFRRAQEHKPLGSRNLFLKFHAAIQWFERPIGAVVEVVWLAGALLLLVPLLR